MSKKIIIALLIVAVIIITIFRENIWYEIVGVPHKIYTMTYKSNYELSLFFLSIHGYLHHISNLSVIRQPIGKNDYIEMHRRYTKGYGRCQ